MPKIYSDLEKTEIANAVSITTINKKDIENLQHLVAYEFARTQDVTISREKLNGSEAYVVHSKMDGLEYKSKLYFIYKNGTGCIINFTATKGTYDKNLQKFEDFYKNLQMSTN